MRLIDGMPYTPAVATNIRATFQRISAPDDWQSRLEGAREVMRKHAEQNALPPNVTAIKRRGER